MLVIHKIEYNEDVKKNVLVYSISTCSELDANDLSQHRVRCLTTCSILAFPALLIRSFTMRAKRWRCIITLLTLAPEAQLDVSFGQRCKLSWFLAIFSGHVLHCTGNSPYRFWWVKISSAISELLQYLQMEFKALAAFLRAMFGM